MKKLLIFLMILIPLVVIFIVNVTVDIVGGIVTISVDNIVLDCESHVANINDSFKLNATIMPEGASNKQIIWSSSNPEIATVDAEGNVTFISFGSVDIVATSGDGLKSASCHINITDTRVHNIAIYSEKTALELGETTYVWANVIPATAENQNYVLRSSNENVISINSTGVATAESVGSAIITATSLDGNYEASLAFDVRIPVAAIDLLPEEESITIGSSVIVLSSKISPTNATNKKVVYSSSDPSTATVDSNGRVSFLQVGQVVIAATTADGDFTDRIKINYTGGYPVSINLDVKEATYDISDGKQNLKVNYTLSPADTVIKNITFTSNNPEVATVDQTGLIQMIGGGQATISIKVQTSDDTFIYETILLEVKKKITGLSFDKTEIVTAVPEVQLFPTITPSDATEFEGLKYEIISGDAATIDNSGKLTFTSVGSVRVKACLENTIGACAEITVKYTGGYPVSVEKIEEEVNINTGESYNLSFILTPIGTSIKEYSFAIVENNPNLLGQNVISLDNKSGKITGLAGGYAIVRLYVKTSESSEITTDYVVNVSKKTSDINITLNEEIYENYYISGNNEFVFNTEVVPFDASDKEIVYTLSDNSIAKIIDNKVHFNGAGKVQLIATLKANNEVKKVVNLWYTGGYAVYASVTTLPELIIANNTTFNVSLNNVVPANATNKSFKITTYNEQSTNNKSVFGVLYNSDSTSATINALNSGSADFAITLAGSTSPMFTKALEVKQKATSLEFVTQGGTTTSTSILLQCNVLPLNATNKNVVFTLDEAYSNIAYIENNTLHFYPSNNQTETVKVIASLVDVDSKVISKTIEITTTFGVVLAPDKNEITIAPGNKVQYDYSSEVLSGYYLDYEITSGQDCISIENEHDTLNIIASKAGIAEIQVTLKSLTTNEIYKILANLEISVEDKITDIVFESSDLTKLNNIYYTGISEIELKYSVVPQTASTNKLSCRVSDENIATYSKETNKIKFLKPGIVEFVVYTNDLTFSKSIVIAYTNGSSVDSTLNIQNDIKININSEKDVKLVSFIPSNINLTISKIEEILISGNSAILGISKKGNYFQIKGLTAGKTSVLITLSDGSTKNVIVYVESFITNISFNTTEIITSETSVKLNPIISPADASNKEILYSVSDTKIAEVSTTGVVTFKKMGTIIITAKSAQNNSISAIIKITSTFGEISDFTLNYTNLSLMVGETRNLTVTEVFPADSIKPDFEFKINYYQSNNNSGLNVISIQNGTITALNGGIATVEVSYTLSNGERITKIATITVQRDVSSINISFNNKLDVYQNYYVTSMSEVEFMIITNPIDASINNQKITVSDNSIAKVQNSKITFLTEGIVKITINIDNVTHSFTIRHTKSAVSFDIKLNQSYEIDNNIQRITVLAGTEVSLSATRVIPSDIISNISAELILNSPNSVGDIVCRYDNGKINTLKGGTAKFRVFYANREYSKILEVVVIKKAESISIQDSIQTSKKVFALNPILTPADASYPTLKYEIVSNASIATIDVYGQITFSLEGIISVKITNEYAGISKTISVEYSNEFKSITFNYSPDYVFIGKSLTLSVSISPENIENETVVWEFLDSASYDIANISQNGVITPKNKEGTVTVVAYLKNYPTVVAYKELKIYAIVTDINLNYDASTDNLGIAGDRVFGTHNVLSVFGIHNVLSSIEYVNTFKLGFSSLHNAASTPQFKYNSSNLDIATVDSNGIITVLNPGTVTITVEPMKQISNVASEYIFDSYTFTFVTGVNIYDKAQFLLWATPKIVLEGETYLEAWNTAVLQNNIDFNSPDDPLDVRFYANRKLYGNGYLMNLYMSKNAGRTIYIENNFTAYNANFRGYNFQSGEMLTALGALDPVVEVVRDATNVNFYYCNFENGRRCVQVVQSHVNFYGCTFVNSFNAAVVSDIYYEDSVDNIMTFDSCIFENNMLGTISAYNKISPNTQRNSYIITTGFLDMYNWLPVSLISEMNIVDVTDGFLNNTIQSVISEKFETVIKNYGYMFKTYNGEPYIHMGILFIEANIEIEGFGVAVTPKFNVTMNNTNNPYALQTIKEPIATGHFTMYNYSLSGSSTNSIQPGSSFLTNKKAAYEKIQRALKNKYNKNSV